MLLLEKMVLEKVHWEKRLAEELGYIFKDIEEYYFLVCNTDYNATVKSPENFTLVFAVRE